MLEQIESRDSMVRIHVLLEALVEFSLAEARVRCFFAFAGRGLELAAVGGYGGEGEGVVGV
jgi:hypothetical protein